jgi:hypothetical protein
MEAVELPREACERDHEGFDVVVASADQRAVERDAAADGEGRADGGLSEERAARQAQRE